MAHFIFNRVHLLTILTAVSGLCAAQAPAAVSSPAPATAPAVTAKVLTTGIAAFNMAWAGTADDFKQYLAVCSVPSVAFCETRARTVRGATGPTPEETERATKCQDATIAAAGGKAASMLVAPCNAYRSYPPPGAPPADPALARDPAAYAVKLANLRATVEGLIEREGVRVLAFQEVKSVAVIRTVLGKFADRFDMCEAKHNAFQTVAFAWDKSVTSRPGQCTTHAPLAILDPPADPAAFRRVRPGLALELTINGSPVTFMNVHLKAGCASVTNANERFPGRQLTDAYEACDVFNRQLPVLEDWIESVAAKTPRFVLLGDFNRRIDDEQAMNVAKDQVRADGSDPAGPNKVGADGKVSTRYLWPEIADGVPMMHQVPLSTSEGGCKGFTGLDHVVISDPLRKLNAGVIASHKVAAVSSPDQAIETSDHCPRIVQLKF